MSYPHRLETLPDVEAADHYVSLLKENDNNHQRTENCHLHQNWPSSSQKSTPEMKPKKKSFSRSFSGSGCCSKDGSILGLFTGPVRSLASFPPFYPTKSSCICAVRNGHLLCCCFHLSIVAVAQLLQVRVHPPSEGSTTVNKTGKKTVCDKLRTASSGCERSGCRGASFYLISKPRKQLHEDLSLSLGCPRVLCRWPGTGRAPRTTEEPLVNSVLTGPP